jgi:hypothetical protein
MTLSELSALGVTSATVNLVQGGLDTATLTVAGADLDAADVFDYAEEISIEVSGTTVFRGWCRELPKRGTGGAESHSYVFHGPGWFLDHLVYRQNWRARSVANDPESAWATVALAKLKAGMSASGAKVTTGVVIGEVLDYAIAAGKPLAKGTVPTGVNAPTDEFDTSTCMEVINRVLRWTPDVVMWWNYATNPATLNLTARSGLTPVSISLVEGTQVTASEITPRSDLQVSAVHLTYRWGGADSPYTALDRYPVDCTGTEDNALVAALDLEHEAGTPGSYLRQEIVTAPIPGAGATELVLVPWLKTRIPWLNDPRITNIKRYDVTGFGSWTRELVEGTLTPWMADMGVDAEQITITGTIDYELLDSVGGDVVKKIEGTPFSVTLTATDATTREYKKRVPGSGGYIEPQPTGLAAALHAALSQLHYQGSLTTVAAECRTDLRPGKSLNLTGARSAWATMAAVVQTVSMDLFTGTVLTSFGPPAHLAVQDLVALLKPVRLRNSGSSNRDPETNDEAGGDISQGGLGRDSTGSAGEPTVVRQFFRKLDEPGIYVEVDGQTGLVNILDNTGETTKEVRIRLADIPAAAAAAGAIELRELDYCDGTTAKKILVLCSAPYTA